MPVMTSADGRWVATTRCMPAARAFYPSDQLGFKKSLALATLRRRRFAGPSLGRIHTRRDTVLEEKNIEYIVEGLLRLIDNENE